MAITEGLFLQIFKTLRYGSFVHTFKKISSEHEW